MYLLITLSRHLPDIRNISITVLILLQMLNYVIIVFNHVTLPQVKVLTFVLLEIDFIGLNRCILDIVNWEEVRSRFVHAKEKRIKTIEIIKEKGLEQYAEESLKKLFAPN